MSCDGCLLSAAMERQRFEEAKTKAKQDAISNQKDMAVYKDGFEYRHIEAATAFADGYLIVDIVSQY